MTIITTTPRHQLRRREEMRSSHMEKANRWYCPGCGMVAATLVEGEKRHRCPNCASWMRISLGPCGIRAWVARKLIWILVRFNHELPKARRPILEGEILQRVHTATWQQRQKKKVKLDEGLNKLRKGGVNSSPPENAQPPPPAQRRQRK